MDIENNFDKLPMKVKNATKIVAERGKKNSASELSKAAMLLIRQCQAVEHGNNVDFLW